MIERPHRLDDERLPIVPFVPFRCPRCGRHKPFTSNVRGRVRQHRCQACGCNYRSLELTAEDVRGDWKNGTQPQDAQTPS